MRAARTRPGGGAGAAVRRPAHEPEVSAELERTITRRRARRRREECLIDLARPDEDWWLSFATDAAPAAVAALLEHPDARELPAIGRALVPLDDHAAGVLEDLDERDGPACA